MGSTVDVKSAADKNTIGATALSVVEYWAERIKKRLAELRKS